MEERLLMKWFQSPFTGGATYKMKKVWWRLVAAGLHKENRELCAYADKWWNDWEKENEEKEELEEQLRKLQRKSDIPESHGYWYVTENSCSRLDEKFIEWYKKHHGQVQGKLEFKYEREITEEEDKRRHNSYREDYDERYDD